ncbi:MAG: hypothetical protein Q7K57_24995 [Burkholderiaceae bacterium]|nr:hypothetical protein [Burkholderiaceae bacterium]
MKKSFKSVLLLASLACAAVLSTGCASADYAKYADTHIEKSKTEAIRYDALDSVARHATDPSVKVAAAMALAFANVGQGGGGASAAPPQNTFLEFVKTLGGVAVPLYGMWTGSVTNVVNSTKGPANTDVANTALGVLTPNIGSSNSSNGQ